MCRPRFHCPQSYCGVCGVCGACPACVGGWNGLRRGAGCACGCDCGSGCITSDAGMVFWLVTTAPLLLVSGAPLSRARSSFVKTRGWSLVRWTRACRAASATLSLSDPTDHAELTLPRPAFAFPYAAGTCGVVGERVELLAPAGPAPDVLLAPTEGLFRFTSGVVMSRGPAAGP